ncbi:MAG: MBL fold metallo-hydrolase [Flavobacteriales bacterium]|nr:MBL fold metallo-hydrolase [Flavobacteriales bacterium]
MKHYILPILILLLFSCSENEDATKTTKIKLALKKEKTSNKVTGTSLVILGTIQDAGSPQIGCIKNCCKDLFLNPDNNRKVVSLGLIDTENQKKYIFEATPDFITQTKFLKNYCDFKTAETPDGIFLTHAHIGHYTGLMHLGKEAMNADSVLVYVMPKMKTFLEQNGPWSQLVTNENILLKGINNAFQIKLTPTLTILPFIVPHRDEYSETVGYKIVGPNKSALFIPDIDKWNKWNKKIIEEISNVDYAFIDATFFDAKELNNRNMADIPHPFIIESMNLFNDIPKSDKNKIYFIHFNHTNPVIDINSEQAKKVIENGYNIAQINDIFKL